MMMFKPGDKIRRKPQYMVKYFEGWSVLTVARYDELDDTVYLVEPVGGRPYDWDGCKFDKIPSAKPLEDWL